MMVDEIRFEDLGRLGITFLELAQPGVAQESAFSLVRPRGIDPLSDHRFFTKVVTQSRSDASLSPHSRKRRL